MLPNPYHYIGMDKNLLQTVSEQSFWHQNPCKTVLAEMNGGSREECRDDDAYPCSQSKEASL
jgi:hypothetical protein